jgi:putative transposase
MPIFDKPGDYQAFLKLLEQGRLRTNMRILGYCLMPNHWHLVLWPRRGVDLSCFVAWVCTTHVRRWREHRDSVGEGHLYQGRYKSFPVQDDLHLLTLLRYVEANPLRAGKVQRAQDWPWSSLGIGRMMDGRAVSMEPWPVHRPGNWAKEVNAALADRDLEAVRLSVKRGRPFGGAAWVARAAERLGLASSLRDPWRPRKERAVEKGDTPP